MTTEILILLLAFQIKHLIADYYLQTPYMYENKGQPTGWMWPLFDHVLVHIAGTTMILATYVVYKSTEETYMPLFLVMLFAIIFDFTTHFITDRIKAIQPEGPDTKKFWTNLGWDQLIHHSVGIIIIFYITYV